MVDLAPNPREISIDVIRSGGMAFRVPLAAFDTSKLMAFLKTVQKMVKDCGKGHDTCPPADAVSVTASKFRPHLRRVDAPHDDTSSAPRISRPRSRPKLVENCTG
jgi:hypothetical protein